MATFALTDFSGGISQENFAGSAGQVGYLENINIDERKYMQLDNPTELVYSYGATNESVHTIVETPNGIISMGPTKLWLGAGDKSAVIAGGQRFEFFGNDTSFQSNIILNATTIYKANATITSQTNITHAVNANVTASCIDLNTILFAKDNIIYRCDVSLATPLTPTVEINTIPLGSKILYLYVNNNILTIVTKTMSDTVIYMANLNTATNKYALYQNEKIVGVTCLGAVGDRNSIYWVSATTIYQFNGGQSQEMTKFGYSSILAIVSVSSPILKFQNNYLYVYSLFGILYKYGSVNASRRWYLTTRAIDNVVAMSGNFFHIKAGTANSVRQIQGGYASSGYSITLPYDGQNFVGVKDNLAFLFGYILPIGIYTGTQCSILIQVMTDEMELINPNTYITVATITDSTKRRGYVTVQEINTALSTSSRSPEWQYIRFKIILNGGNEASGVMTKTPLAWSMRAVHNNTKDELGK